MSKCKVIASLNYKGGVGKSTLIILLSRFLAKLGFRVLMIDQDGQNSTSFHFGVPEKELKGRSLYKAYCDSDLLSNIVETSYKVDIIVSSFYLNKLRSLPNIELKRLIDQAGIKEKYDFILIDTPPNLDYFCYSAALVADKIIVPYTLGEFDIKTTAKTMELVAEMLDINPQKFNTVANIVDGAVTGGEDNLNTQMVWLTQELFPDHPTEFFIPKSKPLKKAMARGEVISEAKNKATIYNALCDFFENISECKRPTSF